MTRHHAHIPAAAILMIVGAVACFSVADAIIKTLASSYPIPLLVWARWGAQVLAMVIWLAPRMGLGMIRTRQLRMQLVRGVLLIGSSLCFIAALRYLPLADATALNYLTPTLVIVMAIAFLGERLTAARGAFVFAGLAGMLMIVQPGADIFNAASLFGIMSAACYAVYQITTRMLAGEDPRVTLFYPALVGVAHHDARVAVVRLADRRRVDRRRADARARHPRHRRPFPVDPRVPARARVRAYALHVRASRLRDGHRLARVRRPARCDSRSPAWRSSRAAASC